MRSEMVTVRSVKNPSITRKMRLDLALRNTHRWAIGEYAELENPVLPECVPVPDGVKIVVAVIVYNRIRNIHEWIKCWKQSITDNSELVIIHNYNVRTDTQPYESICKKNNIRYIPRQNIGMDIGAFQDVCRGRLPEFPESDFIIWCTDDIIPQRKTFIQEFFGAFKDGVSAACYEVSKEVNPHIRTTGFMMRRADLPKIKFNVDPIRTKSECYDFEHRDKTSSLIDQVKKFGSVVQVCSVECSPLWDTGHNSREAKLRYTRRQNEHRLNFP